MKKKVLFTVIMGLIIAIFLIVVEKTIADRSPIALSSLQKRWLKEMEIEKLYYCYDESVKGENYISDAKEYVQLLSRSLDIEMVEKDLQFVMENKGLILSKSDYWLEEAYYETNRISSNLFSIYADRSSAFTLSQLENRKIGILSVDNENLNMHQIYSEINFEVIEAQNIEELFAMYLDKRIDFMVVGEEYPVLFYQNELIANKVYQINATYSTMNIYVHKEYDKLTDILNKGISYIDDHYTFEIGKINDLNEWEKENFDKLLTKEEEEWIQNHPNLKAGLAINPPYTLKIDERVYGVSIIILKQFERLTGITIEYIVGDHDTLKQDDQHFELDILWLKNNTNNLLSTDSSILSEYVVVGINEAPPVNSIYDLYNYKVGMLFADNVSNQLSALLSESNIMYYQDEKTLVEKLLDHSVEVIILPRIVFDYYEQVMDISHLDIRYNLDFKYESKYYLPKGDKVLQGILNKSILFYNQSIVIDKSFKSIPRKNDDHTIKYIGVIAIIVFIFLLGYFIRYKININEKKKLTYLLLHDALTNLPNKYGLSKYIDQLISENQEGVLFLIDIDNFKTINDRQGSQFGDQILLEYSQRLLSLLDEKTILGRTDGDKFSLISRAVSESDKEKVIDRIKETTKDYANSKLELNEFSISIALTLFPKHGRSFEELYRYAEYTVEEVKNKYYTNGVMEFTFDIYEKQLKEQLLIKDFEKSLENNDFICYIQPQIILPEEMVIGGEMLVRWQHPEKGLIYPGDFIETLEKTGFIPQLDFYVLRKACEQIKIWQDHYPNLKISVNMSPQSLTTSSMIKVLKECIDEIGFNTNNLVMEVTEDVSIKNFDIANKIFTQLKQMGIKVALDDFGKGYSSLSCLEKLSIDILKIDKALIDNIHLKEESKEIYKAIRRIADVLNISVVAEGVEHIEQVEILKENKNTVVQGYYYSKPLCIEDFIKLLRGKL